PRLALRLRVGNFSAVSRLGNGSLRLYTRLNCHLSVAVHTAGAADATPLTVSFVPDSGTSAAALSPSLTLGTVACTSVIGRPWVGAMVLTARRSIQWARR